MKKTQRLVALILAAVLILSLAVTGVVSAFAADTSVSVSVDGQVLTDLTYPPEIENGRILLPIRAVTEALGGVVGWNSETNAVTIDKAGIHIEMTLGSAEALVNGQSVTLDVPPKAVKGTTLVPVRFIAETLKEQVTWNETTRTVEIVSADAQLDEAGLRDWLLALCALDTAHEGGDTDLIGGVIRSAGSASAARTALLLSQYQIYDRAELLEVLSGLSAQTTSYPAWNALRICHLASWGYLAGYLTYEETLAVAGFCADILLANYASWDAVIRQYLTGYYQTFSNSAEKDRLNQYYQLLKQKTGHFDDSMFRSSPTAPCADRLAALWETLGLNVEEK